MQLFESRGRMCIDGLRGTVLVCLLTSSLGAQSAAQLLSEVELIEALKSQPPCCVIDARSEGTRKLHPLDDALVFRADLAIIPTASVIVIGDDNVKALSTADALAKKHPGKDIYAVRGGMNAWAFVRRALDKAAHASGAAPAGVSFVIPHNTCETGNPLQILNANKPPKR